MSNSTTPRGQTQTALVSIGAAVVLVALKLGTGIATGSLALVSAGIESSGDVVAAILTLLAVRLGGQPPDREHPYGHRRAENLAALGEAAILTGGGIFVVIEAVGRLSEGGDHGFDPRWYVFAVIGIALAIDVSRVTVSIHSAKQYKSAALRSNAFHFAGDMAGSFAVLLGIAAVALGFQQGDAIASLLVAAIIFTAASRLIYENARVLMDTSPLEAQAEAEAAIRALDDVELRQLRLRESGGLYFADATIGAAPDQALVASHRVADRVEAAVRSALPDADVVVHVEPLREGLDLRARALAIALAEPAVQEAHDIAIYRREGDGRCGVSMHLKLDATTPLVAAHEVAERIEAALRRESDVDDVQTHLEPLEEPLVATAAEEVAAAERIAALVEERTGAPPRRLKLLATERGLVVFVDVVASPKATLEAAHDMARRLEQEIRRNRPEGSARIVDVVVHTEP
ncbi:MAG TPA: cation diffusion facilitator family transporter [Solirubrobacterales bacterium]|nr:cation diffusion facilitator family transporter [Solirubrobacterales bacterium]